MSFRDKSLRERERDVQKSKRHEAGKDRSRGSSDKTGPVHAGSGAYGDNGQPCDDDTLGREVRADE